MTGYELINSTLTRIFNKQNPSIQNYRTITVNGTGAAIKAVAGSVYRVNIVNAAASILYVKLYDKATAPTASDTPVLTLAVSAAAVGATVTHSFIIPEVFTLGIGVRAVTGIADNDNTNPGTAPIIEVRYV